MTDGVEDSLLACPIAVHEEIKSDPHRVRTETVPIGVLDDGVEKHYLRNCVHCRGTVALPVDVDAPVVESTSRLTIGSEIRSAAHEVNRRLGDALQEPIGHDLLNGLPRHDGV